MFLFVLVLVDDIIIQEVDAAVKQTFKLEKISQQSWTAVYKNINFYLNGRVGR